MSKQMQREFEVYAERWGPRKRWYEKIADARQLMKSRTTSQRMAVTRRIYGNFANCAYHQVLTAAANSAKTLDSKFWPELFRYYHFERWKIRTDFEYEIQFGDGIGPMMRKKPGLDIPTGKLARTMITALLFDDHEFLDWAGPLLTHHFWRRSDVKLNNSAGPVSGFGLRLWAISKGWDSDIIGCSQSTKIRAKDGKLHHDVIDSWDDDKKFRQAMPALVKYLHDDGRIWLDRTWLPIEFMVIQKLRTAQGRAPYKPKHSWLKMPVSQLPAKMPKLTLPKLFKECHAEALKRFPELKDMPPSYVMSDLVSTSSKSVTPAVKPKKKK